MGNRPFGDRYANTRDMIIDHRLGESYRVVEYVYNNWDKLELVAAAIGDLPESIFQYDPALFATAAQGLLANTAVQPASLHAVAFTGEYGALMNRPTLGTAAAQNVGAFATAAQGTKADNAIPNVAIGASGGVPQLSPELVILDQFFPPTIPRLVAGKIPAGQLPAQAVTKVNDKTGDVVLTAEDVGAVTSAQMAAAILASADTKQNLPGAWTAIPWSASYTDFGATFGNAAYRINSGKVEFRGVAKGVGLSGVNGVIAFTLPANARPANQRIIHCGGEGIESGGTKSLIRIDIQIDGSAVVSGAFTAANYISLESISFSL